MRSAATGARSSWAIIAVRSARISVRCPQLPVVFALTGEHHRAIHLEVPAVRDVENLGDAVVR